MDIVSHLLFGRALAALRPRPALDRGLTAAIVIGSIAPDVDAVLMPTGWDRYLIWHQRGTHALVGTLADAIVLAGLLHVLRSLWRRRGPPRPHARLRHLVLAAWLGCLGHITLDLVSGGTIRLFAPFWTKPFGVAWMAMGDPLIAVPLLLFFLATLAARQHAKRFATITLIVLAALVGVKEISRQVARRAYVRASATSETSNTVTLESAWGSFGRWWVYDRSSMHVKAWRADAWTGDARHIFSWPLRPAPVSPQITAMIDASEQLETVRNVQTLFEYTLVQVYPHRSGTDFYVAWSDIRFCNGTGCELSFGGTFGADGRPREQVVSIGGFQQTRPP